MKYPIGCFYCGRKIIVDQPDNSKFRIRIAYCKQCLILLKTNDTRLVGIFRVKRNRVFFELKLNPQEHIDAILPNPVNLEEIKPIPPEEVDKEIKIEINEDNLVGSTIEKKKPIQCEKG